LHNETPGARWGNEFVHRSGDAYFIIEEDGRCRACRKNARCKRVRLRLVDLRRPRPGRSPGRAQSSRNSWWYPSVYRNELLSAIESKPELAKPFAQIVMLRQLLRTESLMYSAMLAATDDREDLLRRRTEMLRRAETILGIDLPLTCEKVESILARVLQKFEAGFQKEVPTSRPHPAVARLNELIGEARGRMQGLGQINL
jgi:hypothetical protein